MSILFELVEPTDAKNVTDVAYPNSASTIVPSAIWDEVIEPGLRAPSLPFSWA